MSNEWAPGGMYDTDTVTEADRFKCFTIGHDVRSWGSLYGWCHRCKHSVHNYGARRRVLYYGKYHSYPPKHEPMAEKNARVDRMVKQRARALGWIDYPDDKRTTA